MSNKNQPSSKWLQKETNVAPCKFKRKPRVWYWNSVYSQSIKFAIKLFPLSEFLFSIIPKKRTSSQGQEMTLKEKSIFQ